MKVLGFLGMCVLDFVIGRVFDLITETIVSDEIKTPVLCKIGQPFAGALR
jgi:hypothetical protein